MFLEEGEDPLEKLAEKPKPKAEKPAEPKQANVKQADTKGKPAQPTVAKKPAPLKESQSNVIKPTEQKTREGKILLTLLVLRPCPCAKRGNNVISIISPSILYVSI